MNRKTTVFLCFFLGLFLLAGCGKNKELTAYREEMELFFQDIALYDEQMNAIDPQSDSSVTELLTALSGLEERFRQMAELPVPDTFSDVETLADEASSNMTEAVSRYYQVYESETFDSEAANAAEEYYRTANQKVNDIIKILRGEAQTQPLP